MTTLLLIILFLNLGLSLDPNMDKSKAMGFEVPEGTWMASYKINNEETWKKIKAGELNGFSVAGQFIEKATKA